MQFEEHEIEIKRFQKHLMFIVWPFFFFFLFVYWELNMVAAFFFLLGIYKVIVLVTDKFYITNRRVMLQTGIIKRDYIDMPLSKVNQVTYNQSIIGRALGYGDISVSSAATFGNIKYTYVSNPQEVKGVIVDSMAKYTKQ